MWCHKWGIIPSDNSWVQDGSQIFKGQLTNQQWAFMVVATTSWDPTGAGIYDNPGWFTQTKNNGQPLTSCESFPFHIFPSRVSSQGYKIGPVCMSVCQRSHSWTVWATDLKFGRNVVTARDVTAWCLDILWRHLGKNTDKEGTLREGVSTLRRFHSSMKREYISKLLII